MSAAESSNVYPTAEGKCPACRKPVKWLLTQEKPRCPACGSTLPTAKPDYEVRGGKE